MWKSEDGGTTFKPVFDKQPVKSIGAVALDPTNHDVMWVGTGESWTRNSVSIGNGVYKSTDGGETWTNVGLPQRERITRILVHPKNGNIVYVCAPGALWSDSPDRGLYKTTDGGKTWSLILKGANLSTGCSSVAMDPANPEHLLAGTWDFRRKPYEFRSGGNGPDAPSGSRFAESRDGGRTWTDLNASNRKGLPPQPWGRLEIAYAPSNPKQVYAFIENVRPALFVSEDGGASWQERDRSQGWSGGRSISAGSSSTRRTPKRLFKMGFSIRSSPTTAARASPTAAAPRTATGTTSGSTRPTPSSWSAATMAACGTATTAATSWRMAQNLPISQFYHVSTDNKDPYQVYGGLQDNSAWVGDQEYPGGITNSRWENLLGGDGFWAFSDPVGPQFRLCRICRAATSRASTAGRCKQRDIQPTALYKEKLRFNWNTPIALSPNEKGDDLHRLAIPVPEPRPWRDLGPDLARPQHQRPDPPAPGAVGRNHGRQQRRPR